MSTNESTPSFTPPTRPANPRPAFRPRPTPFVPGKRFLGILVKSFDKKVCVEHNFKATNDPLLKSTYDLKKAKYSGTAVSTNSKATAVYENGLLVEFDAGIVVEEETPTRV